MMRTDALVRTSSGGVINTDREAYHQAIAKRKQDKYIKGLEQRITKLESALSLLENTVKEITK